MDANEVMSFITENPLCFISTSVDNQPRVRAVTAFRADKNGIVFITGTQKDVNKELNANPKVEMCFFSPDRYVQLRVSGEIQKLEDDNLKKEILDKFSFLKPVADLHGLAAFTVWRLASGMATCWDQEDPYATKEFIDL